MRQVYATILEAIAEKLQLMYGLSVPPALDARYWVLSQDAKWEVETQEYTERTLERMLNFWKE